jgi:L-2-hydroxyglutarate oxidase LhgO
MTDELDCVVVGAGVIGLAIARSLALAGREVVVLESESEIGMHTSSRNSEVIHAGIYYAKNSLKAKLCVLGRAALYDYCDQRHVPYQRIGKLIVATSDDELARLQTIQSKAFSNGVNDVTLINEAELKRLEPNLRCKAALLSPSTGIIDSHSLMLSLQADIEANGGFVVTQSRVESVKICDNGFRLRLAGSGEQIASRLLINAAGLYAEKLASSFEKCDPRAVRKIRLAKGHYFAYQSKSPFKHLVYPLPVDGGLGIHATNDLGGSVRFGPDVEWVDDIDYSFDDSRLERFAASIRCYYPGLDSSRLVPAYTGIRPKLTGPGDVSADFVIESESEHGVRGLINLYGIESPGLTSSLAIGDYVNAKLQ